MQTGNAGIKMESRIRICIGIKTMPIHNTGYWDGSTSVQLCMSESDSPKVSLHKLAA